MFKRCLVCRKYLFKKYDVVAYKALDENNNLKEYKAYLCKEHADEIDNESI